jgi:hypothetical protein
MVFFWCLPVHSGRFISEASLSICQPYVNFVTKPPLLATVDGAYCIQCCIQYHQKNYFAREIHLPAARCVYGLQRKRIMVCAANCMRSRYSTASSSKKEFISEMAQITAPPLLLPVHTKFLLLRTSALPFCCRWVHMSHLNVHQVLYSVSSCCSSPHLFDHFATPRAITD